MLKNSKQWRREHQETMPGIARRRFAGRGDVAPHAAQGTVLGPGYSTRGNMQLPAAGRPLH